MNVKSSSKYTGYQAVQISHQNLLTSFSIYFQNAWIEVKRRWCYYMLSLLSVLIVVTATSTCQTIIDNAPLIFLKTAEGTAAERDIVITPAEFSFEELNSKFYINGNFLNFTRVREVLHPQYSDVVTPRADLMGKYVTVASKEMNCDSFAGFSMNQFRNNQDILKKMQICKYLSMNLRLIDTNIERRMGLGRDYPFDEIPEGSCLIHKKLANYLGVEKNDIIFIDFDMNNTLSTLVERFNFEYKKDMKYEDIQYARFLVPMIIHDIFEESYGKYADGSVETTILAEYKHFFKHSSDFLINFNNSDSNNFKEYLSLQNPFDFAWTIIINYPNRISLYLNSNYDSIQQTLTKQASLISERLGVYPFSMQLPVLEELYPQRFSAMFLGVILNMILFILFLLSVILLYSLLLVSVETKTFDFGVIRVLGLNKIGVIGMILVQSLSYVIPGIVFGLILSIPALLYAKNALNEAIGVSISILPTPYAAGFSILLGLLIPIFSSYVPIREALKQNLQTALDVTHSKTSAVKITIDVEGKGFPWGRISFSLIASLFGISIYYLLPLSLLSFNLGLLIGILFWILIGLLLGLVILSLNVQHLMERLIVYTIFGGIFRFISKPGLTKLILKNLAAHRLRNRRTGTMYSLSLAFVIFLIVTYDVQIKSASFQIMQQRGVYLELTGRYIDVEKYETLVKTQFADDVESYSWVTEDLVTYSKRKGIKSVYLTHIGQIFQFVPLIYGVSPNIFTTTFPEFLDIDQRSESALDIVEELYTARGSQSMILGASYADKLRVSLNPEDSLYLVFLNGTYTKKYEMRISSILNTAPAFRFSNLPSVSTQTILVSLPTYAHIGGMGSYSDLPMTRLKLKIKGGYDTEKISKVYNGLSNSISKNDDIHLSIWDYRDFEKNIQKSQNVINIIFVIVTIIVMFLCFFSLVSSMSANILEQTKEISVLRSIGITIRRMVLLYIYEAFVLVFASSFTGLLIGTIVGFTMSMQRALFTQLPIKFDFPLISFIVILVVSIFVSVFSTLVPSMRIMKKEISVIMKMQG